MARSLNIDQLDRRAKWLLLGTSLLTLGFLVAAAMRENIFPAWRQHRVAYKQILEQKATDDRGRDIAKQFGIRIEQNHLPELQRTDRCITCHTGIDDPRMTDQPQPFTMHPGKYVAIHPPAKFGCTVCHDGQGLATETDDAHGRVAFWDYPMMKSEYMHATCTRCHTEHDLTGPNGLVARLKATPTDLLSRGKQMVEEKGCLGCHMLAGKGGTIGPDITRVGDKTRHEFDFSHFDRHAPREVEYWLREHFLNPGAIAPATVMPVAAVSEEEATALTAYMLSLRSHASPTQPQPPELIAPSPKSGAKLYGMYCAACHGKDGINPDLEHIRTPSLNNEDTLATADDEYYRYIITHGRSGTKMPAWGDSGLSQDEINRIVAHIRNWEADGARLEYVHSERGDVQRGLASYRGLCANCHGPDGKSGIGNALNSESFLTIATDQQLADTIINGRPGTAMASWKHLSEQQVSDLLAYIRTWQPKAPPFAVVQQTLKTEPRDKLFRNGRELYRGNCASCHGDNGEGGIGISLSTPDLLRVVDDRFLYRSIVEGRPSTAMPGWTGLNDYQLAALITYIRDWQKGPAIKVEAPREKGDYQLGEVAYRISCRQCHGEDGRGGSGPQLANPALLSAASDDTLFHWISKGRTGTAMKGFAAGEQGVTQLRPAQIMDIIAYLRNEAQKPVRPILRTGMGNPRLGWQLYAMNCGSCHGPNGEGGSGPQLNNPAMLKSSSDGFLAATIVLGRTGTPMRSMVHGQEGLAQMKPSEVQDVIAFMRLWEYSEAPHRPRSVAEMSERAITSGRQKYGEFCSSCHGPNGKGQQEGDNYFAPSLNNPQFLAAASDGFLQATIARGRSRTPMRPFGHGAGGIAELEAAAINDIVSFLRSWQPPAAPVEPATPSFPVAATHLEKGDTP